MSKLLAMLMNLQKEQFINLNIYGSPTINNNIVSNFSSSNYIRLDYPFDLSKNIEIEFDFTTSNDVTTQQSLFWQDKGFGCFIQNNNLLFYVRDNNENISKTANITISANTNYKIRIVKIGTTVKWFIGTTSLIEQESFINRDFTNLTNYYMTVGTAIGSNTYFSGSVNFANSYTKVDNIKYKYQFTISLTKVGNPTIVDGVVSGFSSSDYLRTTNSFSFNKTFEINIKTKLNTVATGFNGIFIIDSSSPTKRLSLEFNGQLSFRLYRYDIDSSSIVSFGIWNIGHNNDWINVILSYDYDTKILNLLIKKEDTILYSNNFNNTEFIGGNLTMGYVFNLLNGEIDNNNSNIILDGTKYIFTLPQ